MIKNSVSKLQPKILFDFDFGKAVADIDDLLESCFCDNASYRDLLARRRNVLVGDAGSGKSAFFRMLTSPVHALTFDNPKGLSQTIIPIREDLNYKLVKSLVLPRLSGVLGGPVIIFRLIWEVFILYRTFCVAEEMKITFPTDLMLEMRKICSAFSPGIETKNFSGFYESQSRGLSMRIESTDYFVPPPRSAMNSFESLQDSPIEYVDIDRLKRMMNRFLRESDQVVYIIIDNLDDFVIKEEYDTQKEILEALLLCQKNYGELTFIKIVPFIRRDLFERIDKSEIGATKVNAQTTEIRWTPEYMREFIARRVMYNLKHFVAGETIELSIEDDEFYLYEHRKGRPQSSWRQYWRKFLRFLHLLPASYEGHYDGRETSLSDQFSRSIITFIFPRKVTHVREDGEVDDCLDIFQYFSTHFSLGYGSATPRIIVMYLDEVLARAREYLTRNGDEAEEHVFPTEYNEFPLIKKDYLFAAYGRLQETMWNSLIEETRSDMWRNYLRRLRRKISDLPLISAGQLRSAIKASNSDETHQFFGYCCHKGLLHCENPGAPENEKRYAVPILFREKRRPQA